MATGTGEAADPIEPDDKDWTWVLERACPDCGFDPAQVERAGLGERIRTGAALWAPLLAAGTARERPEPTTWSVLEYACHVRDVHRVFGERLTLVLAQDDPVFANWDQDATALAGRYRDQDPQVVGVELVATAQALASAWEAVGESGWERPARRSNGSVFTVETLGRYLLHDLDHHAWDVRAAVGAATRDAYDAAAGAYIVATPALSGVVRARLDALAARLGPGARVLEIGTGGGRDADHLETGGLSVRRTDVTPAFVAVNRAAGHRAAVLDPLVDDLTDPCRPAAYDGVWAGASLLHVARADLPTVLARLAAATRAGGVLMASVKRGDGEGWSTHGSVASPRRFVYWRSAALAAACEGAGWRVEQVEEAPGLRGEHWLMVTARRAA